MVTQQKIYSITGSIGTGSNDSQLNKEFNKTAKYEQSISVQSFGKDLNTNIPQNIPQFKPDDHLPNFGNS